MTNKQQTRTKTILSSSSFVEYKMLSPCCGVSVWTRFQLRQHKTEFIKYHWFQNDYGKSDFGGGKVNVEVLR